MDRLSTRDTKWLIGGVVCGVVLCFALGTLAYLTPISAPKTVKTVKASPDPGPNPSPSPTPSVRVIGDDRIISIIGRDGLGHACPISPTDALTADHVAVDRLPIWGPTTGFAPFIVWGDSLGFSGTAQWRWSDKRRDLSLIQTVPGTTMFSAHLRRADQIPVRGDKLYIVGFDFGNGANNYTIEAKATGLQAGMLVYSKTPGGGSSGSCVLNSRGEFVGINVWSLAGEGAAMLVVGKDWAEVPDAFLEGER